MAGAVEETPQPSYMPRQGPLGRTMPLQKQTVCRVKVTGPSAGLGSSGCRALPEGQEGRQLRQGRPEEPPTAGGRSASLLEASLDHRHRQLLWTSSLTKMSRAGVAKGSGEWPPR